MKKINYILIVLLSLSLLGIALFFINDWKVKRDIQNLVTEQQTKPNQAPNIQAVKHIKNGDRDFYYFSPIKTVDRFYDSNLPTSLYANQPKNKAVVMIKPQLEKSNLKNVKQLAISQTVYRVKPFGLQKMSQKIISRYHVKENYERFTVKDLVSGHLERIEQEVSKRYPEKSFALSKSQALSEKDGLLSDGFRVVSGKLKLTDGILIPLSDLFDVIDASVLEASEKAAYDDYQAKKKAEEARRTQKLVALTFDDGPDPSTTPQVLSILAKYQAKGTFFMLGSKIAGNESLVKKVTDAGHEIDNHSWDHPDLTTLTAEQVKAQVNNTSEAIKKASGQGPIYLRPPYGATNESVRKASGLTEMLWTVDTRDWENHSTDGIMANLKQQLQPGGVVLMHDIHQTTVDALPTVMEYLKAEGYQCVTLKELFGTR
ncbi:polysaccharide deacetylase family protein [Streptococcus phocae subsp. salmonis]|uniref:polysaccharide deacetylase family protein n=1 Tax=Streptococcus phocae TaxID=119224 RepID=UPI0005314EFD|nr:polysaccharide deacetylase family protein [Streptococcus phocae]KGR72942.1 deacetylase [Streptococcus phocae subsp. salmonis]